MKAIIVDDIDDATEPGSVEIRHWPKEAEQGDGVGGLAILCPGCGQASYLPIRVVSSPGPSWDLVSENPLTISPSVFHTREKGGCGWHGWLKNGEWRNT